MRDPYTSTQGSEAGVHDSLKPAQVTVPSTMLTPFTGKQPGRSYAVHLGIGVCALAALLLLGYELSLPPDPGTAVLNTRPTDVNITVDGKLLANQTSPVTLEGLAPDVEHVIEISKDGFKPNTQRVTLKEGEVQNLSFVALEPLVIETGFTLNSNPPGAAVFIDGKPIAQVTPVKVTDLTAGQHTLRLEQALTHKPWEAPVTATTGQMQELPVATMIPLSAAEAKRAQRAAKLQAAREAKAAKAKPAAKEADDDE